MPLCTKGTYVAIAVIGEGPLMAGTACSRPTPTAVTQSGTGLTAGPWGRDLNISTQN